MMDQLTKINPHIHTLPETGMNREIPRPVRPEDCLTRLNPHVTDSAKIAPGTMLCEDYQVLERLSLAAGEADLYLCRRGEESFAAKVYRRSVSLKPEVAQALEQLDCPYVAGPLEVGRFRDRTVEILPFYPLGSLRGRTFSPEQLKEKIIPCLNEGLHALHGANIVHKDLKPSNIMCVAEDLQVAIIDFGISSPIQADTTMVLTQTGMTPEYCAPETFKGLYSTHSDYYSLGITLYELFCGETPYSSMAPEEIEKYLAIQRIPFPENMPGELQDLIRALTYPDISNRKDKANPNRRWGYEEVKNWLAGIRQTIPGEGVYGIHVKPYVFEGQEYRSVRELTRALAANWKEGKKHLMRGLLAAHFDECDFRAAGICREAMAEATRLSGKDDLVFWKTLCALDPSGTELHWKGRSYEGLSAFGRELLECLRQGDYRLGTYLDSLYREEILSRYVALKEPENEQMYKAVKMLETSYLASEDSRQRRVSFYLTGYMLSGQKILQIGEKEFHTVEELIAHLQELLGPNNQYLDRFRYFCHLLVDRYENLVPELESWLLALGRQEELEIWRRKMRGA